MPMLRFDDAERAKKMCQDEWLNASVIPLQIALDHLQSEVFAWWVHHNICERTQKPENIDFLFRKCYNHS